MTENGREYLNKARAFYCADEEAEAVGCYAVVIKEDPENPEAKFFMEYMNFMDSYKEGGSKCKSATMNLISSLENAVKYIAEDACSMEEKLAVVKGIANTYTPVPGYVINRRISPIGETIEKGVLSLYRLGSYIEKYFNADPKAMALAIIPWKEAVKQHQKWYAYKYEGIKAEDFVAKIQKVEPAYTMPKKAGCISLG